MRWETNAYKIGFFDGMKYGYFAVDLDLFSEDEEADYRAGYDEGLTFFCTVIQPELST